MRKIVGISLITILLWACAACNSATEPSFGNIVASQISILELKALGKSGSTPITRDLRIRGVVTANDIRGEFPFTIVVQDPTGAIEIAVEHPFLCDLFPLGETITVYCNGLALGNYGNKIQLGARPTSTFSIDRIPHADIGRYIRLVEHGDYKRTPRNRTISEIGSSDIDTYINIDGVHFKEQGTWCDRDPETDELVVTRRTIIDTNGNELAIRTLPHCHYATEPTPSGMGSINGIVDYFYGELSLRIVNYEISFTTFAVQPKAYPSAAGYYIL